MPTPRADKPTIGFVGIGTMGSPMATNLSKAGHRVVVFDVNRAAAGDLAARLGVDAAEDLPSLGAACDVVVTMLPNSAIVRDAVLGSPAGPGAIDGLAAGAIVVDMSSSDPLATRDLGAALRDRGIALLDAPVSGGVRKAVSGTLSLMLGGDDPEALDYVEPLLAPMGSVFRTGGLGSGHATKAINNYVSAAGLVAACEAVILAQAFGLDAARMTDVINASTGRNNSTEVKIKPFVLTGDYRAAGFALNLMAKDVGVAADLAGSLGLSLPSLANNRALWKQASGELGPAADHTEIHRFLHGASRPG